MIATKKNFTKAEIAAVWSKALVVDGIDANVMRQDYAGAWIRFTDYGNRNSQFGWEIDHLKPLAQQGDESIKNYLPLQWQNNVRKGDDYPRWATAVTSDGQNNIEMLKYWKINS